MEGETVFYHNDSFIMKEENWEDRVLLKLGRKYRKDEAIAMYKEKLSKVELSLDQVNSKNKSLLSKLNIANNLITELQRKNEEANRLIKKVNEKNNKLNEELRRHQTEFGKSELLRQIRKEHGKQIKSKNKLIKTIRKNRDQLINKLNKIRNGSAQ